jgi:hypothetical protein
MYECCLDVSISCLLLEVKLITIPTSNVHFTLPKDGRKGHRWSLSHENALGMATARVLHVYLDHVSASSDVLYENEDLYEDGGCMRICIRTRVMHLISDRAFAYAYGRLYIDGPLALEIEKSINKSKKHPK